MIYELPRELQHVYFEFTNIYKEFFFKEDYGLLILRHDTIININPALAKLLDRKNRYELLGTSAHSLIENADVLIPVYPGEVDSLTTELKILGITRSNNRVPFTANRFTFQIQQDRYFLFVSPLTQTGAQQLASITKQISLIFDHTYHPILLSNLEQASMNKPQFHNDAARDYFDFNPSEPFDLNDRIHPKDKVQFDKMTASKFHRPFSIEHLNFCKVNEPARPVVYKNFVFPYQGSNLVLSSLSDDSLHFVNENKHEHNQKTIKDFFTTTKQAMIIIDNNLIIREANLGFLHQFKYREDHLIGKDINNFFDHSILCNRFESSDHLSQVNLIDYYGSSHKLTIHDIPIYLEDVYIGKYILFASKESPVPLEYKLLQKKLFNLIPEQLLLLNENFHICWAHGAYSEYMAFSQELKHMAPLQDYITAESLPLYQEAIHFQKNNDHHWQGMLWFKLPNNSQQLRVTSISPLKSKDGGSVFYAVTLRHIQAERERNQLFLHLAYHDLPCDVPNGVYAEDYVTRLILDSTAHQKRFAMLQISCNHFSTEAIKGHHATTSDVLRVFSDYLKESLSSQAIIARLDSENLLIVHKDMKNKTGTFGLAAALRKELQHELLQQGYSDGYKVNLSAAVFPSNGRTYSDLRTLLEDGMQKDFENKGPLADFENQTTSGLKKEGMLIRYLKEGLHKGEFHIVYQPLIDLKTKQVTGIETLLRWENESVGSVPPRTFIPLAEKSNAIVKIGYFVIGETIRKLHQLRKRGHSLTSSINISLKQLEDKDFSHRIVAIMDDFELPPESIQFEITESITASSHNHVLENIERLNAFGIRFNIDDFGTGYSSLKQMKSLNIRGLKIDNSLIQNLEESPEDLSVLKAICSMAKNVDLKLIAEGVETEEQLRLLEQIGFEEAQGFLFSTPLIDEDIESFIEKSNGKPALLGGNQPL